MPRTAIIRSEMPINIFPSCIYFLSACRLLHLLLSNNDNKLAGKYKIHFRLNKSSSTVRTIFRVLSCLGSFICLYLNKYRTWVFWDVPCVGNSTTSTQCSSHSPAARLPWTRTAFIQEQTSEWLNLTGTAVLCSLVLLQLNPFIAGQVIALPPSLHLVVVVQMPFSTPKSSLHPMDGLVIVSVDTVL